MATVVGSVAGGNWNTNGAWLLGAQPTAADDVQLNATVGNITIPTATTAVCRSIDCTGYTGTLTFASTTAVLTIGDGTAGAGNVALLFVAGMTVTLTGVGTINFISTSGTQQTIDSGGKTLPVFTVNGAGSSYLLSAALTTSGGFSLTAGTFNTGNFNCQSTSFTSSGSTARTLTPGSSTWTLTSTNTSMTSTGSNFTLTANTSTFKSNATSNAPNWGTATWNDVVMDGAGSVIACNSSGLSCANFTRTGTAIKTDALRLGGALTCSGTFTCNGNSITNRMYVLSSASGTQNTITAATVTVTNSDFQDTLGAGAGSWNLSAVSGGTGDSGNNSGITFTTPVTRYAVVAGNWSNTATWSSTSGGSGGSTVPLSHDTVILDGSSGAGTYTADMPRIGKDITCTGFTRTYSSSINNEATGNLTLASGMTFSIASAMTLAGRGSQTLTSAGKNFASGLIIAAGAGSYTLQDALSLSSTITLTLTSGTLNTNSYSVGVGLFASIGSPTRALTMGTTTMSLNATSGSTVWNVASTGLTLSVLTGTITIATTSSNTRTFTGGGLKYGTLTYTVAGSTGQLTITGANYHDTINFSDVTNARILVLPANTVFAVRVFNVNGTSGKLMSVNSSSAGTATQLALEGEVSTNDYLEVKDMNNILPYKFYAGANSTNTSGNTNVIFTAKVTQPSIWRENTTTGTGTSATVTFPYSNSATAGNILVAVYTSVTAAGTVTGPSGYTLLQSNTTGGTNSYIWYKVAAGGETTAAITNTTSVTTNAMRIQELGSFTGYGQIDVSGKVIDSGSSITALASVSLTNTDNPAIAVAFWGANGGMTAFVSLTNSYHEARYVAAPTTQRAAALPLTSNGATSTTYTWTTSRTASSVSAIFKGGGPAPSSGQELSLMTMGIGN